MSSLQENVEDLKILHGGHFFARRHQAHPLRQEIDSVLIHHCNQNFSNRDIINSMISLLGKTKRGYVSRKKDGNVILNYFSTSRL